MLYACRRRASFSNNEAKELVSPASCSITHSLGNHGPIPPKSLGKGMEGEMCFYEACKVGAKMETIEVCQYSLKNGNRLVTHGPIRSLGMLRKLTGYFEKGPGPSQAQGNIIPGNKTLLFLLSNMCLHCALTHSLPPPVACAIMGV